MRYNASSTVGITWIVTSLRSMNQIGNVTGQILILSSFMTYEVVIIPCRKRGSSKRTVDGAVSGPRNCSDPDSTVPPSLSSTSSPSPATIRLEGGRFPHEGNIMVNGQPVCDDDFTLVNADVACKQLGFIGAVSFTKESRYGRTSPEFAMDQVRCDGTEERLLDCRHSKVY